MDKNLFYFCLGLGTKKMIKTAKILRFHKIWLHIIMDNFPENTIFMGLTPPFAFRRRGWGMRPKSILSSAFGPHFPFFLLHSAAVLVYNEGVMTKINMISYINQFSGL
jgi:hypothetical protein